MVLAPNSNTRVFGTGVPIVAIGAALAVPAVALLSYATLGGANPAVVRIGLEVDAIGVEAARLTAAAVAASAAGAETIVALNTGLALMAAAGEVRRGSAVRFVSEDVRAAYSWAADLVRSTAAASCAPA